MDQQVRNDPTCRWVVDKTGRSEPDYLTCTEKYCVPNVTQTPCTLDDVPAMVSFASCVDTAEACELRDETRRRMSPNCSASYPDGGHCYNPGRECARIALAVEGVETAQCTYDLLGTLSQWRRLCDESSCANVEKMLNSHEKRRCAACFLQQRVFKNTLACLAPAESNSPCGESHLREVEECRSVGGKTVQDEENEIRCLSPHVALPGQSVEENLDKMTNACYGCISIAVQDKESTPVRCFGQRSRVCDGEDEIIVKRGNNCDNEECWKNLTKVQNETERTLSLDCHLCIEVRRKEMAENPRCKWVYDRDWTGNSSSFAACVMEYCGSNAVPPPPDFQFRKTRGAIKLKMMQSVRQMCADAARCKEIALQLARTMLQILESSWGQASLSSVAVTHLCEIPKRQANVSESDLVNPNICHLVPGAIYYRVAAGTSRLARVLAGCDSARGEECNQVGVYVVSSTANTPGQVAGALDEALKQEGGGKLMEVKDHQGNSVVMPGEQGGGTLAESLLDAGGDPFGGQHTPEPVPEDGGGSDAGIVVGIIFGIIMGGGLVGVCAVFSSRKAGGQTVSFEKPYQAAALEMTQPKASAPSAVKL
eukprot:Hpha_TRINITY_DN10429_c0_g1::TRINITY_DN10429_c0_g1_i1::g.193344::m.193344